MAVSGGATKHRTASDRWRIASIKSASLGWMIEPMVRSRCSSGDGYKIVGEPIDFDDTPGSVQALPRDRQTSRTKLAAPLLPEASPIS
jgi:hypothetical protein